MAGIGELGSEVFLDFAGLSVEDPLGSASCFPRLAGVGELGSEVFFDFAGLGRSTSSSTKSLSTLLSSTGMSCGCGAGGGLGDLGMLVLGSLGSSGLMWSSIVAS